MHLEFVRKRKQANETHFAQVVRLIKFWAKLRKDEDDRFRFKSFMTELILAHLADAGCKLNDYPEALAAFFNFLVTDAFRTTIAFSDYYHPSACSADGEPVRIWDPVNCENNVAKLYTDENKSVILDAAMEAGDAIDAALHAVSKGETLRYWRKVFGTTFDA
jgi:hypothetical protein